MVTCHNLSRKRDKLCHEYKYNHLNYRKKTGEAFSKKAFYLVLLSVLVGVLLSSIIEMWLKQSRTANGGESEEQEGGTERGLEGG